MVSTDALMISLMIDAKERRDVVTSQRLTLKERIYTRTWKILPF